MCVCVEREAVGMYVCGERGVGSGYVYVCVCVCGERGRVQVSFISPLASSALHTVVFHKEPVLLSPHSGKQAVAYIRVNSLYNVCTHDIIWRAWDGVNLPGHFFLSN